MGDYGPGVEWGGDGAVGQWQELGPLITKPRDKKAARDSSRSLALFLPSWILVSLQNRKAEPERT